MPLLPTKTLVRTPHALLCHIQLPALALLAQAPRPLSQPSRQHARDVCQHHAHAVGMLLSTVPHLLLNAGAMCRSSAATCKEVSISITKRHQEDVSRSSHSKPALQQVLPSGWLNLWPCRCKCPHTSSQWPAQGSSPMSASLPAHS